MLGSVVKTAGDRSLSPVVSKLARRGLRPATCHLCEVLSATAAAAALYLHLLPAAVAMFLLHGVFDYLDGALRRSHPSLTTGHPAHAERSHAVADKLSEAAIFLGLALGQYVSWGLVIAAFLTSIAATVIGFLMFSRADIPRSRSPFDRTDRMLVLLAFLVVLPSPVLLFLIIGMNGTAILWRLVAPFAQPTTVPQPNVKGSFPMPRDPHRSAVAAYGCSFAALVVVPLSFILALVIMESMPRGEISAWMSAIDVALAGGTAIGLAIYSLVLVWSAKRGALQNLYPHDDSIATVASVSGSVEKTSGGRLSTERSGWALAALLGFVAPFVGLFIWGASLLWHITFQGPPSSLPWAAVPLLIAAAGFAWSVCAVRWHGLTIALLPALAVPLAGMSILSGTLGLVVAVPLYRVQRSCGPSLYSFDGTDFTFDCEPYAGAIQETRTAYNRLNHLRPAAQRYRLKMSNELDETQYTDELKLLVVDHPTNATIALDADGTIHTITSPVKPTAAHDSSGADLLDLVCTDNGRSWESNRSSESTGPIGRRTELFLEFPKPNGAHQAKLLLTVSNTPWASSSSAGFLRLFGACYPLMNAVRSQARKGYIRFEVQAHNGDQWTTRGVVHGASPRLPKQQVVILDVSDVPGDRLKLRLPLVAGFWRIGNVQVDYSQDVPVRVSELEAAEAMDQQGHDILSLLQANDAAYYVTENGDHALISFPEPPPVANTTRSFVLKARGYYTIHAF